MIRNNWTKEEILAVYETPLLDLIFQSAAVHRQYNQPNEVQISSLVSIKTGGCPEDCAYCPQAARYHTDIKVHPLMKLEEVKRMAENAKQSGVSRVCLGAAWREVRDNRDFDRVLEMVTEVNAMGIEVCCTLGMLNDHQAQRLKEAGLYAYNHNIDTSEENYGNIITSRKFSDRVDTIQSARKAGLTICSGGIVGLGETVQDRVGMLHTLATMDKHPESVPVNALVAVEGTPLGDREKTPIWDMLRTIATARIIMPRTVVRLSAGRLEMSVAEQALCFLAGANSIFIGEKLLTTPNPSTNDDVAMFELLGLTARKPFQQQTQEVRTS